MVYFATFIPLQLGWLVTNTSFINRSILFKNIHTVEITNIDVFYASFTISSTMVC